MPGERPSLGFVFRITPSPFTDQSPCEAFVLSIDIRRSTDLMLKARDPKLYAEFIIGLAGKLRQCVLDNYGVFDKFTGDGILAFFPSFYGGDDAGYRAVMAAVECHRLFTDHYAAHRHCFMAVLKDTGLGIGLDFGRVHIVAIGSDVSVVGTPVVYACRMAGASAGKTMANQPAYEQLFTRYAVFNFEPDEIDIKHEGATLAYAVQYNGKPYAPLAPVWAGTAGMAVSSS